MQRLILDEFSNLKENLSRLNKPPIELFYKGNLELLNSFKIAIVGTRNPNPYTRMLTTTLAKELAKYAVIVSGGAIGIDSIAHSAAFPNTIMISPSSLDIIYPKENAKLIKNIMDSALIISEYESGYYPHRHSFLERNRIVIAMSDIVILPQGDLKSGTSASARYALRLNKPIFTLPQRYGESSLTNSLLEQNKARAIYDIDEFIKNNLDINLQVSPKNSDEILEFCKNAPSFEVALAKFGSKILEYEFLGLLEREGNRIKIC